MFPAGRRSARSDVERTPETAFTPSSFSGSFDSALEIVREATILPGAPLKMTVAGGFAGPQQHRMFGASLVAFFADRAVVHSSQLGITVFGSIWRGCPDSHEKNDYRVRFCFR